MLQRLTILLTGMVLAISTTTVSADEPVRTQHAPDREGDAVGSLHRWTARLLSEIEHLQEDLYFERREHPRDLIEQAETAVRGVVRFEQILDRNPDGRTLVREFREMDREVHELNERLERSRDRWLERSAQRIRYADEQLHYHIQSRYGDDRDPRRPREPDYDPTRELLLRHIRVLRSESIQLKQLANNIRGRRDQRVTKEIDRFADEAEHFYEVAEKGASRRHLQSDFASVDEAWHDVVNRLNSSQYGWYFRRVAQRVNLVHNQIHTTLNDNAYRPPQPTPRQPDRPNLRPDNDRPQIRFSIPGIGSFQLGNRPW